MNQPQIDIRAVPGGYQLTSTLVIPRPRGEVFDFFADAFQLETITPPWLRFSVLTPKPIVMQAGALIDYRLRLHGVPIRWRSRISVWEPEVRFVDEQVWGPYRRWYHEHLFEETAEGTRVLDDVRYSVPGGRLVHALFVRGDLRRIWEYRWNRLHEIFSQRFDSPIESC